MEELISLLNKNVNVSFTEGDVILNKSNISSLNNFGHGLYSSEELHALKDTDSQEVQSDPVLDSEPPPYVNPNFGEGGNKYLI